MALILMEKNGVYEAKNQQVYLQQIKSSSPKSLFERESLESLAKRVLEIYRQLST